jgi:esterase/lipase superfamily enzyme
VAALVSYADQTLGVALDLCGGGFGCFEMGFTATADQASVLDKAISTDRRFQNLLNDLNAHTALIRTHDTTQTYCAFHEIKVALATNRRKEASSVDDKGSVTGLFGSETSKDVSYGIVSVDIEDRSKGQPKASLLKRVWRQFDIGDTHPGIGAIVIRRVELIPSHYFKALIANFEGKGTMLMIHGYANSFDDAIRSCARGIYQTRIDQLELLPILFSWPSRGTASAYLPDMAAA